MRCYVDIIMSHTGGIRKGDGRAEVMISTELNGEPRSAGPYTVEVKGESRQTLAIRAVVEALKHFTKSGQEIVIRMEDPYVRGNWQYLQRWHAEEYRGRNGKPVKNEQEWRLIWMVAQSQHITFEAQYGAV
ncbi:MAG: hypothetical protein IKI35_08400 [Stomatobaculum sp.]|nr:hypothetical protein [Stomatobaculum sp.]